MKTVSNIPRKIAENATETQVSPESVWISITEPDLEHSTNPVLDKLPTLKLKFWDITNPVCLLSLDGKSEGYGYPPSEHDAKAIVDFLLQNSNKHVIVNCKAGKSRSGAVAQFCHDMLGMRWPDEWQRRATPNSVLYRLMVDYYLLKNPPPTKIIDKRRR